MHSEDVMCKASKRCIGTVSRVCATSCEMRSLMRGGEI